MNLSDLYKAALGKWGFWAQMRMAQEECAELIVAINKLNRHDGDATLTDVCEAVADVEIMMLQIRIAFGDRPSAYIDRIKREKLARLERMVNDEADET